MTKIKLVFKYALKDLGRQRVRTLLGIFGVMISVGLLAIVLFLSDTISVAFVDYLSVDAGNQDMVLTIRHYNGEPENRSDYFDFSPAIETIQEATSEIEKYIPRMELSGSVNVSGTQIPSTTTISGINISLEDQYGFGAFTVPNKNELLGLGELPLNHCAIYKGFNDIIQYSVGDTIEIAMILKHGNQTLQRTVNFTIDYIFDFNLKWPASYRSDNLIVVDINTTYNLFGYDEFNGKCKKLIMTLTTERNFYDVRNLAGSDYAVKSIASTVQLTLGLSEYDIDLPKLEILGYSEFISMALTIIFVFVAIISMLISGILINGILKTSVEERIREFGIFRTLGAHKSYNLAIVLVQGLMLCGLGSFFGIIGAFTLTKFLILPFASRVLAGGLAVGTFNLAFNPELISFIISASIGMSVGLVVSISPALKVMRLQIIESIHPYRHEDSLYHLQKKATVNYKLIGIGLILALNGGFIYFVIPRLFVTMDLSLLAGTLITVLLIFLIGLTLAGLGMMPVILRLVIELFRPISKRLHHIIKIFVYRYQRRNTSTVIMFAMSFSFVIFTTTIVHDEVAQIGIMTSLRYGSDLSIETRGWIGDPSGGGLFGGGGGGGFGGGFFGSSESSSISTIDPSRVLTTDFKEVLLGMEGIERVSSVIASPEQLTEIYSDSNTEFSADIGDYAGLSTQGITLIGVDKEYHSTVDDTLMTFTGGSKAESFTLLHDVEYTCIISEAISVNLNLGLNQKVRIEINRGDELEIYTFTIVGLASSMPGFSARFGGTSFGAGMGGVMISQETYLEIMDIPSPAYADKFFIKLQDNKQSLSSSIEETIDDNYQNDYDYRIFDLASRIAGQQSLFAMIDTLFSLILMSTIVISIFGLLASSYSTIIERTKEIGVVRTLGLKGREINKLFIIEALIIMFSSGTVGVLVGYATGWLLSSNMGLLTDVPAQSVFPWTNVFVIFGTSALAILLGMLFLLRKVRKKKIVEIYRETM